MYYHGLSWRTHHGSSLDIDIDEDDILDSISTDKLVKLVSRRKRDLDEHPEEFKKEEQWRKEWVETISVDLDDYDLMYREDESLEDFSTECIIEYLEKKGYKIAEEEDDQSGKSLAELCEKYLFNHVGFQNKNFLLNVLGLGQYATKDDITNRIEELIR